MSRSGARSYIFLSVLVFFSLFAHLSAQDGSGAEVFLKEPVSFESIDALSHAMMQWPASPDPEKLQARFTPLIFKKVEQLDSLSLKAYFYEKMTIVYYQAFGDLEKTRDMAEREIDILRSYDAPPYQLLSAQSRLMFILADLNRQEEAFEMSLEVNQGAEKLEQPLMKSFILRQLCVFYHRIRDYDKAGEACWAAIDHNEANELTYGMGSLYNTLALIPRARDEKPDTTLRLLRKAVFYDILGGDSLDLRIVYRNMAGTFQDMDMPDSAEHYYRKTFDLYERHPYYLGWVQDQSSYGHLLLSRNKLEEAGRVLDTLSLVVQQNLADHLNSRIALAGLETRYYALTGDHLSFLAASTRRDSLMQKEYDQKIIEVREEMAAKYETERREAENTLLRIENRAKTVQTIGLAAICLLLFTVTILLVQKRTRDKKLHAQKLRLSALELKNSRREAEAVKARMKELKADLQQRVKQVLEQQALNAELKELVEELSTLAESALVKKKASQMRYHLNVHTEKEILQEIAGKMEQLYPRLFAYLQDKIGESKPYEIVTTAMYFMEYETRDIALLLQRTEKAVRSMRYRVRKKLGLSDTEDLLQFLNEKQQMLV